MQKLLLAFLTVCVALGVPAQSNSTTAQSVGDWLPRTGTVYVAEDDSKSTPPIQLHAAEPHWNTHPGSNFARAQVFKGPQSSLELKGLNAPAHVASTRPVLYVRLGSDDPELLRRRLHLIQLDQVKDARVVLVFSQNVFGGQREKKYKDIAVAKTDAEPDVWLKVTPDAPLAPGEYGLVSMPSDPSLLPDVVYDFDVAFLEGKPEAKK
jgi:hypothetical protein